MLDSEVNVFGDDINRRVKKVLLSKWNNNKEIRPEPSYEFSTEKDFWKSTCSDPYKVGGFIDEDLAEASKKQKQEEEKREEINKTEATKLKKQINSYVYFKANEKDIPQRTGQYFWKTIKTANAYVPHDENVKESECEGLDLETKSKFKTYLTSRLDREPKSYINKGIAPKALIKAVNDQETSQTGYPKHKIIQSSFRAWGNAYLTKQNENLKEAGKWNKQFELANQSQHTFLIKLKKDIWVSNLIKGKLENTESGKKLNESQDISSLLEVYYPISFSFFDPISSYLRKHSLLLKTELDLSNLYLHSFYAKEIFRFDIGTNNREIGKDYQGFEINKKNKEKPYGLDGVLSFVSKLELDKNKDLNIHLTAKVNGFVNTKNPSCDLRHRIYKINGNSENLTSNWKCNDDPNWSYRKHIHIPSYLVISLDREPELSSFYIDRQSGVTELSTDENTPKEIKTLSDLSEQLQEKKIVNVIETDDSNKAEVYFKDIVTYGSRKEDVGFFHDTSSFWASKQQIYYWHPRRASGVIENIDFENLKSITLYLDGSKNSYSSFFHSNHFNTLTTLCVSNKYIISSSGSSGDKQCGDGNNYDREEKDKTPSQLHDLWGSQKLIVESKENGWSTKTDEKNAYEIKFRVTYNRANRSGVSYDSYEKISSKLEAFFKDTESKEPEASKIPDVSMLAFWYSIFFWKDKSGNKLHYATQVRPIGLITKEIKNANSHETVGAAGSAGFEISKFEFNYSSEK